MKDLLTGSVKEISLREQDSELARLSSDAISHFDSRAGQPLHLRLENRQTGVGIEATVPGAVVSLLAAALAQMAQGKSVTLVPLEAEFSTQQAAEMIGVSRPYFIKLLEQGEIPFRKVGEQRRVRSADLFSYIRAYQQQATTALDGMAADAQKLKLYE